MRKGVFYSAELRQRAQAWQQIANRYTKYVYEYTTTDGKTETYYSVSANETSITIGEGEEAQTYPLSPLTYYTYTIGSGDDAKTVDYYGPAGLTTYTIEDGDDAGTYTLVPMYHYTYTDGTSPALVKLEWRIQKPFVLIVR